MTYHPTPHISNTSTSESNIQNAAIFDPGMSDCLVNVINQLDVVSFVNFARSCKEMYHFCCNAHGIKVEFGRRLNTRGPNKFRSQIWVHIRNGIGVEVQLSKIGEPQHEYGFRPLPEYTLSENEVKGLLKLPLTTVISRVAFSQLDFVQIDYADVLQKLSQFLRRFPRIVIEDVFPLNVRDWRPFVQFLQEFAVIGFTVFRISNLPIPTEILPTFLFRLDHFYYDEVVPEELILSSTSKSLCIRSASISVETFKKLLKKFNDGDFLCSWGLGRQPPTRDGQDPFFAACSEVMNVVQVENVDVVTKEHGFLYTSSENPTEFHLKRTDGSNASFRIHPHFVQFW